MNYSRVPSSKHLWPIHLTHMQHKVLGCNLEKNVGMTFRKLGVGLNLNKKSRLLFHALYELGSAVYDVGSTVSGALPILSHQAYCLTLILLCLVGVPRMGDAAYNKSNCKGRAWVIRNLRRRTP